MSTQTQETQEYTWTLGWRGSVVSHGASEHVMTAWLCEYDHDYWAVREYAPSAEGSVAWTPCVRCHRLVRMDSIDPIVTVTHKCEPAGGAL